MSTYIEELAASEGWDNAKTNQVVDGVLARIVAMGAINATDLEALIRAEAGLSKDGGAPTIGDIAGMHGEDVTIVVRSVPDQQPRAHQGVWSIIDQYGEAHDIENEDGRWFAVVPAL